MTTWSRWLTQHRIASLSITVGWMVIIARGASTGGTSPRWRPISWLFVALMAYAGVDSFLLPRLRGFRRFPDGAPILQWLVAVSVFMMGFLGTVLASSPFWLMWVGFGISFAILIRLSLQGQRSAEATESSSSGPSG